MSAHAPITDTVPFWADSVQVPEFPQLERNSTADVVIVGGGITGMTAAYILAKAGRSVTVLERGRLARIDTGHTTAHLTMVTDLDLSALAKSFGRNHAQAAWDAGLAAIARIDAIVREEDIRCGFTFVPGYKHLAIGSRAEDPAGARRDAKHLEDEAAFAAALGFDASWVDDVPLVGGPGIRYDGQARFHPRRYVAGLALAARAHGATICEQTTADTFHDAPRRVGANGHTIACDAILIATHNPLVGNAGFGSATLFQTKLALYNSYVVAGRVASGAVPDALFWDTADPYHFLRIAPGDGFDVVIFGGEDHKTGQEADTTACYRRLEMALSSLIPGVDVTHHWSGQVIETADGLPYIGEMAERQLAATGFSGNGMTFGTLGGMMMADAVLGGQNPWTDLFDPARKKIRGAAWDYLTENKDYPYYMIRDRFAGAEGRSLRSVERGQGRLLDLNGKRVAAYRGGDGATEVRSAICTHMGCEVAWNTAEKTWDCPCHGSRFKPDGAVISGPAESPLGEP